MKTIALTILALTISCALTIPARAGVSNSETVGQKFNRTFQIDKNQIVKNKKRSNKRLNQNHDANDSEERTANMDKTSNPDMRKRNMRKHTRKPPHSPHPSQNAQSGLNDWFIVIFYDFLQQNDHIRF